MSFQTRRLVLLSRILWIRELNSGLSTKLAENGQTQHQVVAVSAASIMTKNIVRKMKYANKSA